MFVFLTTHIYQARLSSSLPASLTYEVGTTVLYHYVQKESEAGRDEVIFLQAP